MNLSTAVAAAEQVAANACVPLSRFVRGAKGGVGMREAMLWTKYPDKAQQHLLQEAWDAYNMLALDDGLLPPTVVGGGMVVRDILNDWFRRAANGAARIMISEAVGAGLVSVQGRAGHELVELDYELIRWGDVDLEQDAIQVGGARYELVKLLPGRLSPPVPVQARPVAGKRAATYAEVLHEMHAVVRSYGEGEGRGYTNGELQRPEGGLSFYDRHVLKTKAKVWAEVVQRLQLKGLKAPYSKDTFDSYTRPGREHELTKPYNGYRLLFDADTTTQVGKGRQKRTP